MPAEQGRRKGNGVCTMFEEAETLAESFREHNRAAMLPSRGIIGSADIYTTRRFIRHAEANSRAMRFLSTLLPD